MISILKSQVELLTKQLEQKDSQIDHLQRLLVAPETIKKPTLVGRFGRGLKAFLK
ncbi:hypothetical protein SKM62_11425 [Acinetobacter faecalis]|uniref:hypothetical protein n=1 Tax=Acinetobacter faecalis TaxID=2665161 RepID=UPI002A91C213|nr:hypothetical protein [Acinetobacter faecalis]MDY6537515.1 hypothetical protein [Acinetobacter faecalis]